MQQGLTLGIRRFKGPNKAHKGLTKMLRPGPARDGQPRGWSPGRSPRGKGGRGEQGGHALDPTTVEVRKAASRDGKGGAARGASPDACPLPLIRLVENKSEHKDDEPSLWGRDLRAAAVAAPAPPGTGDSHFHHPATGVVSS